MVVATGSVTGAGKKSGDIILIVGEATDGATFGSIILNAPIVTAPVGQTLYFASATPPDTTASGDVGMESADTQASGGNSGHPGLG